MLRGDSDRGSIVTGGSVNAPATTLAATQTPAETQVLQGALLAGKIHRVREERVNVALALLLLVGLLLAQAVDGLDGVLDGAQAVVDVLASAQRDARVGARTGNGAGFLEGIKIYLLYLLEAFIRTLPS